MNLHLSYHATKEFEMTVTRDQVLSRLRAHQAELERSGIRSIAVFGSVARGDNTARSDVDLMGDFDSNAGLTLFDMVGIERRLEEILQAPVDLSDRRMLKLQVKLRADREAILAF